MMFAFGKKLCKATLTKITKPDDTPYTNDWRTWYVGMRGDLYELLNPAFTLIHFEQETEDGTGEYFHTSKVLSIRCHPEEEGKTSELIISTKNSKYYFEDLELPDDAETDEPVWRYVMERVYIPSEKTDE